MSAEPVAFAYPLEMPLHLILGSKPKQGAFELVIFVVLFGVKLFMCDNPNEVLRFSRHDLASFTPNHCGSESNGWPWSFGLHKLDLTAKILLDVFINSTAHVR